MLPDCVNLAFLFSVLVQGVEQEESKRSSSGLADEDCGGSVTDAAAPSEDPSEGHSSDSSLQRAGSDGGARSEERRVGKECLL